jgi:hypothetical protein
LAASSASYIRVAVVQSVLLSSTIVIREAAHIPLDQAFLCSSVSDPRTKTVFGMINYKPLVSMSHWIEQPSVGVSAALADRNCYLSSEGLQCQSKYLNGSPDTT